MKTPLEIILENKDKIRKEACCVHCGKSTVVNGIAFCKVSGKIILNMHLFSRRNEQCKDNYEFKENNIEIEYEKA